MRPGSLQARDMAVRNYLREANARWQDPLWRYAFDQAYFRYCERNHWFPNRTRHNQINPRPIE